MSAETGPAAVPQIVPPSPAQFLFNVPRAPLVLPGYEIGAREGFYVEARKDGAEFFIHVGEGGYWLLQFAPAGWGEGGGRWVFIPEAECIPAQIEQLEAEQRALGEKLHTLRMRRAELEVAGNDAGGQP